MKYEYNTKRMTLLALVTAAALILHYLEGLLPPLLPGMPAKLGLANCAVLICMDLLGTKCAIIVQVTRCILGPLLGGAPVGMLYSLSGGAMSLLAMIPLFSLMRRRPGAVSLLGVSVAGAFMNILGQLGVGAMLVSPAVFAYFTPMGLLAIPTGLFVGLAAQMTLRANQRAFGHRHMERRH